MTITINVGPTLDEPSHHIRIYDPLAPSTDQVGLIAVMGSSQGQYEADPRGLGKEPVNQISMRVTNSPGTRYSNFQHPYSYSENQTWYGGRGQLYAPDGPTGFYDSKDAWTLVDNQATPAGLFRFAQGYRSQDMVQPGSVTWYPLLTAYPYLERSFVASYSYTVANEYILLRRVGTPGSITLSLYSDSGGSPGSMLAETTLSAANVTTDWMSVWPKFSFSYPITASTTYHIRVYSAAGTATNCWKIGCDTDAGTSTQKSADGSTWSAATYGLYFRLTDANVSQQWNFFEYRGALYAATAPDSGASAGKVYLNGWRGVADSNTGALTKLKDSTQTSWTTAKLLNSIALIWSGPGYDDFPNYRTISSAASGEATVSSSFLTEHTTSTEYIVAASDWWTDQAVGSLTKPITHVASPEEVVYLCQGRNAPLIRWGQYNNSGTWTSRTATVDDSANKADGITSRLDSKNGMQIVRWQNLDDGNHVSISKASTKKWGEDLQFKPTIPIGHDRDKITNVVDGENYLFAAKEDALYAVDDDGTVDKVIDFQGLRSELSGRAMIMSTPYVYFSLARGGFERLLDRNMEDIGLWRGEGLPAGKQGYVSCAIGHPQHIFVAIDAGDTGYSAVYVYNGGWHEIFRAREAGQRILSMCYEVTPGSAIDRLWIGLSSDLGWIPMCNGLNPYYDPNMEYTYEFSITSSWIDDQIKDLYKYIKELKISADALGAARYIEWDYQLDDATDASAWVVGTGVFDTSPSETISIAQTCRRFRYRLRCYVTTRATTMRMMAATTAIVTTIPPRWRANIQWMIEEEDGACKDLGGDDDGQTYAGVMALLTAWASSPRPMTTQCVDPDLDGLSVFVQPSPRRPTVISEGGEITQHVGTVMIQEV